MSATEASTTESVWRGGPAARLFRRYLWLMSAAALVFLAFLIMQTLTQISAWRAAFVLEKMQQLDQQAEQMGLFLEGTASRLVTITQRAEQILLRARMVGESPHPALEILRYDAEKQQFSLDRPAEDPPLGMESYGNILGAGHWLRGNPTLERHLAMAAELLDIQALILGSPRLYRRSFLMMTEGFMAVHPFVSAQDLGYETISTYLDVLRDSPLWIGVQGEPVASSSSARRVFWTPPDYDALAAGLMISASSAIYEQGRLVGVLGVDIAPNALENLFQATLAQLGGATSGRLLLLTHDGQILIDSAADRAEVTPLLYLPQSGLSSPLQAYLEDQTQTGTGFVGLQLVLQRDLQGFSSNPDLISARPPWRLVYIAPSPTFSVFLPRLTLYAAVIVGVLLLMILLHLYVNRTFVRPAVGLVWLIQQGEDARLPERQLRGLPALWQRWFGLLQTTMRERAEARRARDNLARYFPPRVAARLAERGQGGLQDVSRKKVAALFADLRDFTTLTEGQDPEWVMQLLRGFHARMAQAVFAREGILEKYIGDALLAIFGAPEEGEEDASHALLCALDMLAALEAWNRQRQEAGEPVLAMGISLHYGDAVMGDMGRDHSLAFTVIGHTINIASRLQDQCKKQEAVLVLSAEMLYRIKEECTEQPETAAILAPILARLHPAGAVTLRGHRTPVEVFYLKQADLDCS